MHRPQLLPSLASVAAASLISACSSPEPAAPPNPVQAAAKAPAPKSLKAAMEGIEDDWHLIEKGLEANPLGDLRAMAAAAERCAAVMKLAYDPWEDKEVPNFAQYAREAESALLKFAMEAGQGHADLARDLGKTLQAQHCARCHDAVEQVHG
jgi:hypothetical protein